MKTNFYVEYLTKDDGICQNLEYPFFSLEVPGFLLAFMMQKYWMFFVIVQTEYLGRLKALERGHSKLMLQEKKEDNMSLLEYIREGF